MAGHGTGPFYMVGVDRASVEVPITFQVSRMPYTQPRSSTGDAASRRLAGWFTASVQTQPHTLIPLSSLTRGTRPAPQLLGRVASHRNWDLLRLDLHKRHRRDAR